MQTYDRDIILNKITRALNVILKAIVIVIFIFPFYWMVSTSLKDLTEALQRVLWGRCVLRSGGEKLSGAGKRG